MVSLGRLPSPALHDADCLASDAVGAPVYITGPEFAGRWQVSTADAFDATKMPCIGIIDSKPTSTTCVVRVSGEQADFAGLTPGKPLFVGAGVIAHAPVTRPTTGFRHVQVVAVAVSATKIHVNVGDILIKIRP